MDDNNKKMSRSIKIILNERLFMTSVIENMQRREKAQFKKLQLMHAQVQMMITLLRDLMNQAQMANNKFTMVNEYFNCTRLIKRCLRMMSSQSSLKNVQLVGPVFRSPVDKLYFKKVFGDESRYSQIVLNFVSNAIKFSYKNGIVSVHIIVTKVTDYEATSDKK